MFLHGWSLMWMEEALRSHVISSVGIQVIAEKNVDANSQKI